MHFENVVDHDDLRRTVCGEDTTTIENKDEYLKELFNKISKHHPNYPNYGYAWDGNKIIEYRRQ